MSGKDKVIQSSQPRWLKVEQNGCVLHVQAQPGAKRSEVAGPIGDALKIRLSAPPIEGRANEELIRFLADLFGAPKRQVQVISGAGSRRKRVRITGVNPQHEVIRMLDAIG